MLFLSPRGPAVAAHAPLSHAAGVAAIVMAIRVIYQTYAGWDGAIYFSEEVHRPDRNVARATFWGIGLVTVLYVLLNAAVLHVLPVDAIAGSQLALGDAAKVPLGVAGDVTITLIGLLVAGRHRQPADHGQPQDHLAHGAGTACCPRRSAGSRPTARRGSA